MSNNKSNNECLHDDYDDFGMYELNGKTYCWLCCDHKKFLAYIDFNPFCTKCFTDLDKYKLFGPEYANGFNENEGCKYFNNNV